MGLGFFWERGFLMKDWIKAAREYLEAAEYENQFAAEEGTSFWYLKKALAEIEELEGEFRELREGDLPGPDN